MTLITDLTLERRTQVDKTETVPIGGRDVAVFPPPVTEDYWAYRVVVADGQAVVGFPKFFTIGIGFAVEVDWNTNLPYTSEAIDIARHIWENRAPLPDDVPSFDLVVHAIQMIQSAVAEDRAEADE
jgi:hypothetical protein